jgi:hypothetical protein
MYAIMIICTGLVIGLSGTRESDGAGVGVRNESNGSLEYMADTSIKKSIYSV